MIMNLNSQGPVLEPFFNGLSHGQSEHSLENLPGALFTTNEHDTALMNFDLTLTPPSSNNGSAHLPNNQHSTFAGAIPNSIHHSLHHHHPVPQESLSQFFGPPPPSQEMLSPPLKSINQTSPASTTLTTFDLDRNTFLTTATTPTGQSTNEHESQTPSSFNSSDVSLHQLQPNTQRNMKLHNITNADDFHDERICFGCRESLNTSRFILSVSGYHNWHTDCLCCSECGQSLCSSSTCYIHNGRMFCREDYQRLTECSKCRRTIGTSDWVRRAGDRLYHLACFACDLCQRQLSTGENFTVMRHSKNETRLLCKLHFSIRGQEENRQLSELGVRTMSPPLTMPGEPITQSSNLPTPNDNHSSGLLVTAPIPPVPQSVTSNVPPPQPHPVPGNTNGQISAGSRSSSSSQQSGPTSVSSSSGTSAAGSKTKRVRTTFTEDQLSILQANFQIDSNPDGQDLERIAALTGLSKRVTQVWFQNSRARQKKYMSKSARSSNGNGQSPNLMLSLRPGTGASGASSTSGLWSPASSTGSADTGSQSQHPHQQGSQTPGPATTALSSQIPLPMLGSNIKWRTNGNGNCPLGHHNNLNEHHDEESLDDVSPQS